MQISSSGTAVELLATDNVSVNVTLPEAIEGNCEGYLEVHGTAMSKSTVSCKLFVHFPPEMSENFGNILSSSFLSKNILGILYVKFLSICFADAEKYNAFQLTLHALGDKKWKYGAEQEAF